MIHGVLFDMDGVIFDTERLYGELDIAVAKDMGYNIDFTITSQMLGANKESCCQILKAALGESFEYEKFYNEVHRRAQKEIEDNGLALKQGIIELLEYLTENKYKKAIASSSFSPVIKHHLEKSGLNKYFTTYIGGDMVPFSKPDPAIFIMAAKAISVRPSQCIAIEDSFNGVRSAAAAGCHTVMITDLLPPTKEIKELATIVLPSLLDIPAYLKTFSKK